MSIIQTLRQKSFQNVFLQRLHWKNFANDSSKATNSTSAASTPTTSAPTEQTNSTSPFTITGKPNISISQDPVKVHLDKSKINVILDAPTTTVSQPVDDLSKPVSFDSIPGPISLRIINKIWRAVPMISTHITGAAVQYVVAVGSLLSWSGNVPLFKRFFAHYGPVVRLHGPLGGDIVMVSRPELIAAVFKNEGPYPIRSSLDSVEKYRLQYRRMRHAGPFLMFGPQWEKFRKSVEQPLPQLIARQYDKIDETCDRFVERIYQIRNRQEEVPDNFYKEIYKWCLECLCLVSLDKKLGFLDPCGLSSTSDPGVLLDSLIGATKAIQRCEYGLHLWQFMKTPAWSSLVENCDSIDGVLSKYMHRLQALIKDKKDGEITNKEISCLMENVLLKPGIMLDDAMTILLDMMLIGVNATAHTVAFLFYHLAKSPKCQVKLYKEIEQHSKNKLSKENLAAMPYLQACIKETLRLKPPIPLLGRILQDDISIYNYHIPKGTYVLMVTNLAGWRDEYFENAEKFLPERWLDPIEDMQLFASMPFGYGAKSCFGKELAEMQIGALMIKVLKKFKIEYLYGDITSNNKLWSAPTKKLRFRFAERV